MSDRIYPDEHLPVMASSNNARRAVELIGCDGIWPKPCTLRHHKNDDSRTRDEVLARIDAALDTARSTDAERTHGETR